MPPAALPYVYCTSDDIDAVLSAEGVDAYLDDDQSGTVSVTEVAAKTLAINWATSEINFYCGGHYEPLELASSFKVNEWCTDLAARRVCLRRGNPVPESLDDRCGVPDAETGHYHQLAMVRDAEMSLNDINARIADVPGVSNVHVDPQYALKQIRVERPISDQTSRRGRVSPDYGADYLVEP